MNAVAQFQPPRLPYHPVMQERFGVDASGWKALVEAIYPLAKTQDSVAMALSYCKARKLDPFKKPVHIVPMWDAKAGPDGNGGYVETVWPGISEVRTTAFRTGQYSGCDETEFGPEITQTFTAQKDKWENRRKVGTEEVSVTVTFPEWARMTVYRDLGGRTCKFVGPKVYWLESYASQGKLDIPNTMWADRPIGQIEKCAEAAALRKAFPEEIGNDLTAEEMHGRRVDADFAGPEVAEPAARRQPPAPPKIEDAVVTEVKPSGRAPKPPHDPNTGEVEQEKATETKQEPTKAASGRAAAKQQDDGAVDTYDPKPILAKIETLFASARDDDHLEEIREKQAMPLYERLKRSDQEAAILIYQQAVERLAPAEDGADEAERMQDDQQQEEKASAVDVAGDDLPGDRPSANAAAVKPEKMTPAEFEAHSRAYIAEFTDPEALKKRWYMDDELREKLGDKVRAELRVLWKARMDELRATEGQA